MPFKVRCKLVAFMGDEEKFPCHFGYKIGDEFIYDGEKFIGRICSGVLSTMVPVVLALHMSGNAFCERITFRYSGLSARDPSMKEYDGLGFRPLKEPPEGADEKYIRVLSAKPATEIQGGWAFVCEDSRTSALFAAEPFALADAGDSIPYYRREMAILDKIKAKPGLTPEEVLAGFTEGERNEIYPPLTTLNTKLFMDELATVGYIEYRDRKAYAKGSTTA